MSAYKIRLNYTEGNMGPPSAFIVARDPFQDYEVSISPPCVCYLEIHHEVERLKKALDIIDAEAHKRFVAHTEKTAKKKE